MSVEDKLSPGLQHGFLRSEENVILNNFNTLGVWVLVCLAIFLWTLVNGDHIAMAVVKAIVLLADVVVLIVWQKLLLPLYHCSVWQMESHCGRCYGPMC